MVWSKLGTIRAGAITNITRLFLLLFSGGCFALALILTARVAFSGSGVIDLPHVFLGIGFLVAGVVLLVLTAWFKVQSQPPPVSNILYEQMEKNAPIGDVESFLKTYKFEDAWAALKTGRLDGSFEYAGPPIQFTKVVGDHFKALSGERYGVYVVRCSHNGEVVYLGKGGMIQGAGIFKRQDIPGRLKAPRRNEGSNEWFGRVCEECGPLRIEYVCISKSPLSPALAEAILLQAFLNETGRLPCYNQAF